MKKANIKTGKQRVYDYYSALTIKTITEGVEAGVIENKLSEPEYDYIENKIVEYMYKHYKYNVVKEITKYIPTIATVVAAVLRVSTKATVITAVASTVIEFVIRMVIRYFILPNVRPIEQMVEEDDFGEEFFEDEDLFAESPIYDEEEEKEDEPLSPVVEGAVETIAEEVGNAVTPPVEEEVPQSPEVTVEDETETVTDEE